MEIIKEEFLAFESVRESGLTNMLDLKNVKRLSGLSEEVIKTIILSYTDLRNKFL